MITLKEAKRLAKRRSPRDIARLREEATLQDARLVEVKNRDEARILGRIDEGAATAVKRAHKRLRVLPPGNRALRRALNRGANRTPVRADLVRGFSESLLHGDLDRETALKVGEKFGATPAEVQVALVRAKRALSRGYAASLR